MKTKPFVTTVLFLLLIVARNLIAEPIIRDKSAFGLTGPVKEMLEKRTSYNMSEGVLIEERTARTTKVYFSPTGKIERQDHFEWDDTKGNFFVYKYDKAGNLVKMILRTRSGKAYEKNRYDYNERGELIEEKNYRRRGILFSPLRLNRHWEKKKTKTGTTITLDKVLPSEKSVFDQAGRIIEKEQSGWSHQLTWKYKYDVNGRLIEAQHYSIENLLGRPEQGSPATVEKWLLHYNDDGQLYQVLHFLPGEVLETKRTNSYENGKLIRQHVERFNNNGEVLSTWTYSFNPHGLISREVYANKLKPFEWKLEHSYDKSKRETGTFYYDTWGGLSSEITSHYNVYGNIISERETGNAISSGYHDIYKYDSNQQLIEKTRFDARENQISRKTYAYDNFGNLTVQSVYNPDNSLRSRINYAYEYDSKGNWISKSTYSTSNEQEQYDTLSEVLERSLKYYD